MNWLRSSLNPASPMARGPGPQARHAALLARPPGKPQKAASAKASAADEWTAATAHLTRPKTAPDALDLAVRNAVAKLTPAQRTQLAALINP